MRSQSWRSLVAGLAASVVALGVAAPLQAAVFARSSLQVRNISPDEAFLYPGPYRFYADGGLEVSWGPGTDWWDGSGINCWYDCVTYVAGGGVSDVSPGHLRTTSAPSPIPAATTSAPSTWPIWPPTPRPR